MDDLSCHILFPEEPPSVKVIQWKSKTEFIEYIFDKNTGFLYKDDTILTTILKVLGLLNIQSETIVPYVWSKEALRFKIIKNPWTNYHPNPFLATLTDTPPLPDIQQLSDKIMDYKELNFITYSDLSKIIKKPQLLNYYFPNSKDIFTAAEIQSVMQQNRLLTKLWNVPINQHKAMFQQSSCTFMRAFFKGSLPSPIKNYKHLFNMIHSTATIPFIQFCDDINHIYYKVFKKHSIPELNFYTWTSMENIKNQKSIILYSFIKESGLSYAKFLLDENSNIQIMYFLDPSENISFQKIKHHLKHFIDELNKYWKLKIKISIDRLALKTSVFAKNINLLQLSTYFAKLLPIFKISTTKNRITKNILDFQYIRVPKYGQTLNIVDFIKSKIQFEVPLMDIIEELSEYGISEANVREYYEQIQRENDLPADKKIKRKFKDLGLIMHVSVISLGLQIYIDNATSIEEIQNALFWIRAAVYKQQQTQLERTSAVVVPEPFRPPVEEEEEEELIIPRPPSRTGSISSSSSSLSLGGAIGKQHQRFFKNMLEKLDPDVFSKSENYARKCQISDLRQPVGMSKEQKEKIDSLGYSDGYDNYVEYGSDADKTNIYMCPKIYCPDSQIPLSYEKYKELGEKCPDPNDEPILLYTTSSWYNDPLRKHYVGFLKERGYNNLRLPCCFKTPQDKKLKTSLKPVEEESEDTYIIDKLKQLEPGRYGTLPTSLHDFLYPNTPYTLCRNTVKAKECLLRRGITQSSDSLMESIAYLLDFENKEALIQYIYKQLDPFTFLTLENGKVYTYFLSKITNDITVLTTWFDKFPKYVKLFQLEELKEYLTPETFQTASQAIQFKITRQLQIYESYYHYLRYLKDAELKNPYLLFDLVQFLGATLVVWNRDSQNIATIRCPFATKNKNQFLGIPYILVMQQEKYYEPLVIVDPHKNITQKISFTKFEKLLELIEKCPTMMVQEDNLIQELITLQLFTQTILTKTDEFKLYKLVLDYRDKAIGLFLKNNIYISFSRPFSMFSLQKLIHQTQIPHIVYWEDIQSKSYDLKLYRADLKLLNNKLKELNYTSHIGTLKEEKEQYLFTLYTVPKVIYEAPPKLPIVLQDTFIQASDLIQQDNLKWYQIKKTILAKLIKEYDTLVKPLLKQSKIEQLKALRDVFTYLQQPSRTATILEEIPYHQLELLDQDYENLLLEKAYYQLDDKIYDGYRKMEWIFTQKALFQQNIKHIIKPTSIKRPNNEPTPEEEVITNVELKASSKEIPIILDKSKLELKPLPPGKWRSKFWSDYKIGYLPNYTQDAVIELMTWVANQKGLKFNQRDITAFVKKQVHSMLENPKNYDYLLEDIAMRKIWNTLLQRNYRTTKEIIDIGFANRTIPELQQLWATVADIQITNMDLEQISKLLNISFLILHKGKDLQLARGNIDEQVAASDFISPLKNWEQHPLLLMYKTTSEYSMLLTDKTNGYYELASLLPEDIKSIIGKHLSYVS
jgi:hypothetical protein